MIYNALSFPAVILVAAAGVVIVVSQNWRWLVGGLGVMYIGMFVLVAVSWPTDLAVIKLVTGWMAGSVLGITRINISISGREGRAWPTERIFRILAVSLMILTVASVVPDLLTWVPDIRAEQAWGGMILIGLGVLHLGFSARSFRVIVSLLTLFAGFEILYAVVEASTLVAGLLAIMNLGIALAGAYLMTAPTLEESN